MATQYMQSQVPIYHGYSSQQPRYDSNSMQGKNGGFAFRKRFERLDWRKIASVDVDQISRTLDFNSLQENIMNITFCNIETEVDVRMVDPNFIKLFRLAQLTIEYLLHSQDYLAGLVAGNDEKTKTEKQKQNELQQQLEKLQQEIARVKKESHKRKKFIIALQQTIHAGPDSYNKCPYCEKAFLNNSFLQSHINRHHVDSRQNSKTSSPDQQVSINHTLELELREIKERLRMTESQLEEEKRMINSLKNRENQTIATVNTDVQVSRRSEEHTEIEKVQEVLMKEIKEMNEKHSASERALLEMESKYGKRSNLGDLEDDIDTEKKLLHQQRSEVAMIREQLQQEMEGMNAQLQSRFEKQERKWQRKVQQMNKSHSEALKKLNNALENTSRNMAGSGRASPEVRQQQRQVEELLRQSREQEMLLRSEEEVLQKELIKPVEAPVVRLKVPKSPRRPPSPKRQSMVPSDEDDESTTFGTGTHTGSPVGTGRESLHSTMGSTLGDLPVGTAQFLEQLRSNNAIPLMRQQFAAVLQENVERRGIPHDKSEISSLVLDNKLQMLKTQRQTYSKKFSDFLALRKYFDELSTRQAKEEIRKQKRSPRPGNPNQLSSSTPPIMPSPHHSNHARQASQSMNRDPASRSAPQPSIIVTADPPTPAPRVGSPQKTMHSTGSTTEWTSTQWDSDEDFSEEEDYGRHGVPTSVTASKLSPSSPGRPDNRSDNRSKTPTPSPRPRGRGQPIQIKSKPINDFDDYDDFDDSESEMSPRKSQTQPQPVQPRVIMSVPKLAQSIELQLSGRNPNKKPVGGVDTVKTTKTKTSDVLEDIDGSDFDITSDDEKSPPKRPATRRSNVETDFSTNTYGTSAWGSSSKAASSVDPPGDRKLITRNSFTDVSEDDDLNLEHI